MIRNDGELHIGNDVGITAEPVRSHIVSGLGASIRIGEGVRIGQGAAISAAASVEIGARSRLGSYVTVMDSDFHVAGDATISAIPKPVAIGRDVVIGHRVIVLPGAAIGDGVVVLAGSVVSGTVPEGLTVSGNPALAVGEVTGDSVADGTSIGAVVARAFHLGAAPPELRPDDVADWDSLGALRLLLALESAFHVTIDEHRLAEVEQVADLTDIVRTARQSGRRPAD